MHRGAFLAFSGEIAAAELCSGENSPPAAPPTARGRPIPNQRARLDPKTIRSGPSDPNPTAEIQPYPFGLSLLLKSPPGSEYLTRSPPPLKTYLQFGPVLFTDPPEFYQI